MRQLRGLSWRSHRDPWGRTRVAAACVSACLVLWVEPVVVVDSDT